MRITAILLAAGQGTRMKSKLPKVLHSLAGRPLIDHALDTARQASDGQPVVVIGHSSEAVRRVVGDRGQCVVQEPQLGTGHAVLQAESLLAGQTDLVLVTFADMPLLRPETLQGLVAAQKTHTGPITMLTVVADDPRGFGRIIRSETGAVQAIVEEAQTTPEQRLIKELNVSAYCFQSDWLWQALHRIQLSSKGEYYLTDVVEIAVKDGLAVQAIQLEDVSEAMGINTRVHLAEAEAVLRSRVNTALMLSGVTLIDPNTTYIEPQVVIGQDTIIYPNTWIKGKTTVGEDCVIGPNAIVENTTIGSRCKILASVLQGAWVENDVDMGPFVRLRKGAHLADGVHMGNFGEVKDSYLGPGTKMGHFSYIGNANIGANVNIGAGTITCNFDGEHKYPTEIGDNVFIGSDTMLVAPVKIGDGARTGAGAVVTKDVAEDTLVVGVPARPIRKLKNSE